MKKKALTPAVATVFLILIAVIAYVTFRVWFLSYYTSLYSDYTSISQIESFKVEHINSTGIYIRAPGGINLSYEKIFLSENECEISGVLEAYKVNIIDISPCLYMIEYGHVDLSIVFVSGIFSSSAVYTP